MGNGEFAPWVDGAWAAAATDGNIGATAAAFFFSYVTYNYIGSSGGWDSFKQAPGQFLIATTERSLEQGLLQGTLASLQGQSFGSAFRSAGVSTFVSSFGPSGNSSTAGVIRAMIGGTASELSGGKFANGAATALAAWAAESATEAIVASGEGNSPANPALGNAMSADLNAKLFMSGAFFGTYATDTDAMVAWSPLAEEVEENYGQAAELGTVFIKTDNGYIIGFTYSTGSENSDNAIPITFGSSWGHTHPGYWDFSTQFSGTQGYIDDTNNLVDYGNFGGDLVTSYRYQANAFVVTPGGQIFGWNFADFQNIVNHNIGWGQGQIFLSSGEHAINGGYDVSF